MGRQIRAYICTLVQLKKPLKAPGRVYGLQARLSDWGLYIDKKISVHVIKITCIGIKIKQL